MDHNQQHDDLIDLGTASIAIQGFFPGQKDEQGGQPTPGLAID